MGGAAQMIAGAAKDVGSAVNTGAKDYLFGPGQGSQSWGDLTKYGADPASAADAKPVENYLFSQQPYAQSMTARKQKQQNDYQQLQGK